MRLRILVLLGLGLVLGPVGCAPDLFGLDSNADVITAIDNVPLAPTGDGGNGDGGSDSDLTSQPLQDAVILKDSVGRDDYKLFQLGPGAAGDKWTVSSFGLGSYLVVVFDQHHDLLYRHQVWSGGPLEHVLRADTEMLWVGVAPAYGSLGGSFRLEAARTPSVGAPGPAPQVVWVNFGAGSGVKVHQLTGISFDAFDSARLGDAYAGATGQMKQHIIQAMREDYAPFNVVVLSSDEGPPPDGPYSTVHIGGDHDRLLGLADNVDQYNTDITQTAVVFADAFAPYAVMQLTVEEMGQMIGNTASHELGHLLGLYHTAAPTDLMDTTGTAWDLVANQAFERGVLERTVFPWGYENCPARLAEIVGYNPNGKAADNAKPLNTEKALRKAALRAMLREDLRRCCGTCLHLDG